MAVSPYKLFSALLLILLLAGCTALQEHVREPEVTVQDMQLRAVSLTDMELDFILGIDNPNPMAISMSGLSYRLELNDRPLFEGTTQQRVEIAGKGQSRVTLPFSLVYEDILGGLAALASHQALPYELSGRIELGLVSLPYAKRGVIRLPRLPTVQIDQLRVERLDLRGITLQLGLAVYNPNDYPLQLPGLSGDIRLADIPLAKGLKLGDLALGAQQREVVAVRLQMGYWQLGDLLESLQRAEHLPLSFEGSLLLPSGQGEQPIPLQWRGDTPITR